MEIEEVKKEEPCYILSIPNELQIMIFDRMEPADKISYGKSWRKGREIWKDSKSLYDGIGWDNGSGFKVMLSLNNSYPFTGNKHFINFYRDSRDYEIGQNDDITEFGQLEIEENGFEYAKLMFVEKLEKYQNTVKSITIKGECPIDLQNIQHFPNLQYLFLNGFGNHEIFREILSKTGNVSRYLSIFGGEGEDYAGFQQIYQVKYLSIGFGLTREQLLNLSAREILMAMGELKAEDIFEFIRTWQNGNRILKYCEWTDLYDFDAHKFFGFFDFRMKNDNYKQVSIRGPDFTSARITFKRYETLSFEYINAMSLFPTLNLDYEPDAFRGYNELDEVFPDFEFEREQLDLDDSDFLGDHNF